MELILDVANNQNKSEMFLHSPIVQISEKLDFFKDRINDLSMKFLSLTFHNKREAFIRGICRHFLNLVSEEQNIKWGIITTAIEVDDDIITGVESYLESELGFKVRLIRRINPHIIGGLILRIGEKQYDASIATQFRKMKKKLLTAQA